MDKEVIVPKKFVPTVTEELLVDTALKTTASADVGHKSGPSQLAHSSQLAVDPPPSHVRVAA